VSCLNSAHSGEMSEDDMEMVKSEINQFQSIVLTLRKKVQDVKRLLTLLNRGRR
jgi:hypothetical protein